MWNAEKKGTKINFVRNLTPKELALNELKSLKRNAPSSIKELNAKFDKILEYLGIE